MISPCFASDGLPQTGRSTTQPRCCRSNPRNGLPYPPETGYRGAGKVLVNPGRTGFLCTDPEKVEHINFTSDEALDTHLDARADPGMDAR